MTRKLRGAKTLSGSILDLQRNYMCPYCAYMGSLNTFWIRECDGINRNKANCPRCGKNMKMHTVTNNMTLSEWGEWLSLNKLVFNSPKYRFRDDIQWKHIITFLNILSKEERNDFWNGYKSATKNRDVAVEKLKEINIKHKITKKSYHVRLDVFGGGS